MEIEQCINCDSWFEKARHDSEIFCSDECQEFWDKFWWILHENKLIDLDDPLS